MSIKTLHITNSYHPASGGVRTFYNALIRAANEARRPVRVVVPAAETHTEDVGEYARIYHVEAPPVPFLDSRYRMFLPHSYAWPAATPLRRILATEQPDLVEVCDKFYLCCLAGVLRQQWIAGLPVPAIVGLTCERLDNNVAAFLSASRVWKGLSRFYMRRVYVPRFDFHLAVSGYIAEEIRAALPRQQHDRIYVAPMGADYDFFSQRNPEPGLRRTLLEQLGGSHRTALLLYAGRLSKEKNLLLLADVLAVLANDSSFDYRLIVAGTGPFDSDLREALDSRVPGRSLFLGHCDREHLVALYHAADAFLHANPREPFGIAPIEAMAAGLPVVAPDSGGLLSYASSANAWLAAPEPESFADAVRSILGDPETAGRKIAAARQTAASFSLGQATRRYFELYDHFHLRFLSELQPLGRRSFAADTSLHSAS